MRYLAIDTETTGLFDFSKPADHPAQPRLAHLAVIELDHDLNPEGSHDFYVKPDGWLMPPEAGAINGLTTEFLMDVGSPLREVLDVYTGEIEAGRVVIAFNAQYDTKIMRGELRRAGMPDLFEHTPNICVMRGCMGIVVKPDGKRGFPKLIDACTHFGINLPEAHKATHDVMAAVEIARRLRALDQLPEPMVKYAKERPV